MRLTQEEESLGVRPAVASAGAVLLLVPFALIAALIVGNSAWLTGLDLRVTDAWHAFALRHEWWVRFMWWWSLIFQPNLWRLAALGLVIWLVRRGSRPVAWWVAATMSGGGLLGVVMKLLFGRDRPDLLDPVARAVGFAFPSGHALNSALGAAVFLLVLLPLARGRPGLRAGMWVAAVVVPLMTSVSRVALGVHWTSDVVAGSLLGVALVAVTAAAFLARQRRRGPAEVAAEGLEPQVAERR
jgi:undecaprenyl-diphosphatase